MARTDLPAFPSAGRGRGAAVGRDFADGQRLTAVLNGGVGLGDVHGPWGGVWRGWSRGVPGRAAIESREGWFRRVAD
jgi:hypothetical protein